MRGATNWLKNQRELYVPPKFLKVCYWSLQYYDQYYMIPYMYFSLLESMFQFETFPRYLWIFNHGLHPCKLDVNDD